MFQRPDQATDRYQAGHPEAAIKIVFIATAYRDPHFEISLSERVIHVCSITVPVTREIARVRGDGRSRAEEVTQKGDGDRKFTNQRNIRNCDLPFNENWQLQCQSQVKPTTQWEVYWEQSRMGRERLWN